MKKMASLRQDVQEWVGLQKQIQDAIELAQLGDEGLRTELETEVAGIEQEIGQR